MNELIVIPQKSTGIWSDEDSIAQIKEIYGPNLTTGEFNTFIQIGKATGLNPFLREIWAVKYGNKEANIFVGRDGYRKSAQSHPEYDYHLVDAVYQNDSFEVVDGKVNHKYNLADRGKLAGAYCEVKRKNSEKPIFTYVELREYNTNQSVWAAKPATMIKKVAEAQGLRMAFQALFAGTYHESENWEQDVSQEVSYSVDELLERIKDANNISALNSVIPYAKKLNDMDKELLRKMYSLKLKNLKELRDDNFRS